MAADTPVTFTPQTPPGVVLAHFRPWLTIAHQVPGRLRLKLGKGALNDPAVIPNAAWPDLLANADTPAAQTLRTILDEAHEQLRHAAP